MTAPPGPKSGRKCAQVVFVLASLVLVFGDKVKLKPNMSAVEREAVITKSRIAFSEDGLSFSSSWRLLLCRFMRSDLNRNPCGSACSTCGWRHSSSSTFI